MTTGYGYAHDENGLQRRFFELRFDEAERRVSGTAIRYGDVATLPWGEKERFEAGAFGEVAGSDVMLNVQHDRSLPIARTTGGSMRLIDTGSSLNIEAILPDTTMANDAVTNVRAGILRGLSIEFAPEQTRMESDTIVVEKATLRGIGVVDRPAYPKSRVLPRSEVDMNENEIKAIVERTVKETESTRSNPAAPVDATGLATAISGAIGDSLKNLPTADSVREQVEAALAKRDEAEAARAKSEEEKMAMKKKAKDDEEMMKKKGDDRAELLLTVHPLLPKDTEIRGKSSHELLMLAVGDEVKDAKPTGARTTCSRRWRPSPSGAPSAAGGPAPAPSGAKNPAPVIGRIDMVSLRAAG